MGLYSHMLNAERFDDWIGFSDGPNDLKEWQAKDVIGAIRVLNRGVNGIAMKQFNEHYSLC